MVEESCRAFGCRDARSCGVSACGTRALARCERYREFISRGASCAITCIACQRRGRRCGRRPGSCGCSSERREGARRRKSRGGCESGRHGPCASPRARLVVVGGRGGRRRSSRRSCPARPRKIGRRRSRSSAGGRCRAGGAGARFGGCAPCRGGARAGAFLALAPRAYAAQPCAAVIGRRRLDARRR